MTGKHTTDYSDASGMLLLDVKNKCWSKKMCSICEIEESLLPKLYGSFEVIGKVNNEEVAYLDGVEVVAGAGDNAAAAIGTGTIGEGSCNISLGTSGTIFISSKEFKVEHFYVLLVEKGPILSSKWNSHGPGRQICSDMVEY